MTPKEKAEELLGKFYQPIDPLHNYPMCYHTAKQCALIAVEEIIDTFIPKTNPDFTCYEIEYWKEVKKEIELL